MELLAANVSILCAGSWRSVSLVGPLPWHEARPSISSPVLLGGAVWHLLSVPSGQPLLSLCSRRLLSRGPFNDETLHFSFLHPVGFELNKFSACLHPWAGAPFAMFTMPVGTTWSVRCDGAVVGRCTTFRQQRNVAAHTSKSPKHPPMTNILCFFMVALFSWLDCFDSHRRPRCSATTHFLRAAVAQQCTLFFREGKKMNF